MNRPLAYAMACLLMLVTATGAFAQQPVNPCEEDIAKFCSNIRPGKGDIAECLGQNEDKLSPKCKAMHLKELADVLRQVDQVCDSDVSQYCGAESQQGGFQLLSCLRRQVSLSPACKTKLFEALELMHY